MRLKSAVVATLVAATASLSGTCALADVYTFTFGTSDIIQFQLDSSRAPDSFTSASSTFDNVSITQGFGPATTASVQFDESFPPGGVYITGGVQADIHGEPLFTGLPSAPQFKVGTFTQLQDGLCGDSENGGNFETCRGELTQITLTHTPVPEPATWGLMLVGFAGLGAALRRRRSLIPA